MSVFSGTFSDADQASGFLSVRPRDKAVYSLTADGLEDGFIGTILFQKSSDGAQSFETVTTYTGTVASPLSTSFASEVEFLNDSDKRVHLRLVCTEFDDESVESSEVSDDVAYSLESMEATLPDAVLHQGEIKSKDGVVLMRVRDNSIELLGATNIEDGGLIQGSSDIRTSESLTTNGSTATALGLTVYQSILTTGASEGAESATIGDGTGVTVGHQKLITLGTLSDASDSVTLDDSNFSQGSDTITAIALDAAGEFLLAQWRGSSWEIISASSGVVSVA